MLIRHADPVRDAAGCVAVYGPFADDTPASFEDAAPSVVAFQRRIAQISRTHAFLVAEDGGRIAGFAYAGPHRERPAYRWTVEASVYLGPDHHGQGLGRALYEPLFALLSEQGYRTVLAGITVPNPASVGLHRALGFEDVGVYHRVGWTAGGWQDVLWMELPLVSATREAQAPPSPGPPVRLAQPIEL